MQRSPSQRIYSIIYASLLASVATFLIRFFGYILLGNSALLVESLHMGVDIIASVAVVIVIYLVHSNLAKRYPYGLYKIEDLASLFIGIIVLGVAVEITGSIFRQPPVFLLYSSIVELISVLPLAAAGYMKFAVSKNLNSPSLRSDAFHSFGDALEGFAVAFGLYLAVVLSSIIAYYLALLIALIALIIISLDLLRNSIYGVLDLPKNVQLDNKLEGIIKRVSDAKIVSIKLRWAGPVIFSEIVLQMNSRLSIEEAHVISDKIESALRHSIPELENITIHIEPTKREYFKVFIPLKARGGKYYVNENMSTAKYAATVVIDKNNKKASISKLSLKNNEFRGVEIAERLAEAGFTDVITFNIGEMTFGVLLRHNINIWKAKSKSFNRTVKDFANFKLDRIKVPTFEASWRKHYGSNRY